MTNDQLIAELKAKQKSGKIKPSQIKKSQFRNMTKEKSLEQIQAELNSLKEKLKGQDPSLLIKARQELITITKQLQELFPSEQLPVSQLLTKLIAEKNALEMALFEKRLDSLKEFSHYQERLKDLENSELVEITQLKKENQQLLEKLSKARAILRKDNFKDDNPFWEENTLTKALILLAIFGIGALQESLTNYVKAPLENKANDLQQQLESKFKEFKEHNKAFQTTEWIDIGLKPEDSAFAKWLEREGYTALAVLNEEDANSLRAEYQVSLNNPQPAPINPIINN
ncbi:2414_t:CDS:2 [Ambispora gerdemannii]|uniref:2414_t:CDS:1 n=1 Tax=Ambispora gerdemannii TaxID=144530 RepID=A0A9N9AD06_9GLOM|nr:2414_t:CDS:2 [Ambispora gerdemannii]